MDSNHQPIVGGSARLLGDKTSCHLIGALNRAISQRVDGPVSLSTQNQKTDLLRCEPGRSVFCVPLSDNSLV